VNYSFRLFFILFIPLFTLSTFSSRAQDFIEIEELPSPVILSLNHYYFEYLTIKYPNNNVVVAYKASEIGRSHYVDNPFDIDDFSNPFNLPRPGSKAYFKTKKKRAKNFSNFLSTLFEYEQMQGIASSQRTKFPQAPFWILFLLLGLLSLFTYHFHFHRSEVHKNFRAFVNAAMANQQFRDAKNMLSVANISAYSLFILAVGTLIFTTVNVYSAQQTFTSWNFYLLLFSFLAAGVIYLVKHIQIFLLGLLFPIQQELAYYNYWIFNTNRNLGLFLVPALLLIYYSPESLQLFIFYATLFIVGASYIYHALRVIFSASETILFHKFHFFIYLCTVEIVPMLLLLKVLSII